MLQPSETEIHRIARLFLRTLSHNRFFTAFRGRSRFDSVRVITGMAYFLNTIQGSRITIMHESIHVGQNDFGLCSRESTITMLVRHALFFSHYPASGKPDDVLALR